MPRGKLHYNQEFNDDGDMIETWKDSHGNEHTAFTYSWQLDELEEDGDNDEGISVDEAADIWFSNGCDEDSMFGYTEEELREVHDN